MCLRRGQIIRECRSHVRCPKCGGKHHVSICSWDTDCLNNASSTQKKPSNLSRVDPLSSNTAVPPSTQQSTLNADVPAFTSCKTRSTTSLWVSSDRAVFLQIVQAQAFNPNVPQKTRQVRIVLDCGSQRSYVTEQMAKELKLMPKGEQSLTIMTFGSSAEQLRVCVFIRLNLVLRDGETRTLRCLLSPSSASH